MAEIGRCHYDPCGQVDLLPYDGYCSESCREQAEDGGEDQDPDRTTTATEQPSSTT